MSEHKPMYTDGFASKMGGNKPISFPGADKQLPEDPVSLSFWVASNLALAARDRLALFAVDDALLRLHMEVKFISKVTRRNFLENPLLVSTFLNVYFLSSYYYSIIN